MDPLLMPCFIIIFFYYNSPRSFSQTSEFLNVFLHYDSLYFTLLDFMAPLFTFDYLILSGGRWRNNPFLSVSKQWGRCFSEHS